MNGDVMSMLSSIMQDPAAMEKAMSMASMLSSSGILDGALGGESEKKPDNQKSSENETDLKDLLSATPTKEDGKPSNKSRGAVSMNERLALLLAIRPYLSEDKAVKLDNVIRILKIVSTLEKSGIKLF